MTAVESVAGQFLELSRARLMDECWPRMRACVESLTPERVWWRPNDASNSVGSLLFHLNGSCVAKTSGFVASWTRRAGTPRTA